MSNDLNFLITILYGETLLRCALRIENGVQLLSRDVKLYPMEPENKARIAALLPDHVRECGPIVQIEEIFSVSAVSGGDQ